MKTTKQQFQSFEIDESTPGKLHFLNPFPDKYEHLSTRKELIKAWNEECRLRERELDEWNSGINNRLLMLEIEDGRFVTQYLYRGEGREFTLGYIAQFEGKGKAKRYKRNDPYFMYKDFWHDYKASFDGVNWTNGWDTQSGAIRKLLKHHNKCETWGFIHILPCAETFKKGWKELDYDVEYSPPEIVDDED